MSNLLDSRAALWTGYILSGLVLAFMVMDISMKFMNLPIVEQTGLHLGWQPGTARYLGTILAVCTVLYAWPRTAVLGAVLLTGYLGGAVATHMRVGSPLFTHTLFAIYLGIFLWGGLWLREPRLRAIFPLR
jgi:hypothetical protein